MDLIRQLTSLKNKIDRDKETKSQLEGRKKQTLSTLKKEYGCANRKQAQGLINKKKKEYRKKRKMLEAAIEEIEEMVDNGY